MNKTQKKVAVGVGITALAAAAAASTYFFGGKRGAKNRAKAAKWAESAKTDVVKQLKGMKQVTKKSYGTAVDTVLKQYKQLKKATPAELLSLAGELKGQWDTIATEVTKAADTVVATGKKVARSTKKAVTKKAAPKKAAKKSPKKK